MFWEGLRRFHKKFLSWNIVTSNSKFFRFQSPNIWSKAYTSNHDHGIHTAY
jgi:hypothetical protein